MHIRLNKKHTMICLLLCAVFLTSYTGFLNANSSVLSNINIFNASSLNSSGDNSSWGSKANPWQLDYISVTPAASYLAFTRSTPSSETKANTNLGAALIAAQIIVMLFFSQLTYINSPHFNSIQIIAFLHKKDGMK